MTTATGVSHKRNTDEELEQELASEVENLVRETLALEPATWLEAAVFFMAVLGELGFTDAQYERAAKLGQHRWRRYLTLRPGLIQKLT